MAVAGAETPAARIVSTSPSITETLFAIGLGERVVGVSVYCRYPAAVVALPKVGTFLSPNVEIIARLRPDLVLLEPGSTTAATQLQALGVRTAVVGSGHNLEGVFRVVREIGVAAGVDARATELVARIEATLGRVKAAVAGRGSRRVLIIVGRRTGTLADIVAVGSGSHLSELAAIAGGTNVLANVAVPYPRISMETLISLSPEVIVDLEAMGDNPADAEQRARAAEDLWRRQSLVRAAREGQVHVTYDQAFVVPGPRIVDVARQFAQWLHGVTVS
jgi:iron complex transport system substrate-binding protein